MKGHDLYDAIQEGFDWSPPGRVVEFRYWTAEDISTLVRLAEAQATTRQIALELGRTKLAVRVKASRMGLPLTGYEVRRSAKRHAKRQGSAAVADEKKLRQRPRIAITVDFDLSSLARHERLQLAERLRAMECEEGEVAPGGEAAPDAADIAARRPLRIPEPYDHSAATSARHRKSNEQRRANRATLGWNRSAKPLDAEAERRRESRAEMRSDMQAAMREARRELRREARRGEASAREAADPFDLDASRPTVSRSSRPVEDEYAKYRRYVRGK